MSVRDDRIKAIKFQRPERIPVNVGILPAAWMKHRETLEEITARYPLIFGEQKEERDYDAVFQKTYHEGEHTDAWGCVWSNVKEGMEAIVTRHPVPAREAVRSLKVPEQDDGLKHGFMFLRLADLRGFEEIMIDFAEEPPELQMLVDKVLEYNLRQAVQWLAGIDKPESILWFGDDLGTQHGLPIAPDKWRKYLKPCYRRIYKPFKDAGHCVYMHTDGHVLDIVGDLKECGIDVLNLQVGANGLEGLARTCKGKICLDLDLNRQMFPFWKPGDIERHVREAVETLYQPEGGLWLEAEIGEDVPLANVEAICDALAKYSTYCC